MPHSPPSHHVLPIAICFALGLPPPPFDATIANVTSSSVIVKWKIQPGYRITVVKIRFLNGGSVPTQLVDAVMRDEASGGVFFLL